MVDKIMTAVANVDIGGQVKKVEGGNVSLEAAVKNVLSVVFALVGVIAVIMIVVGGIFYIVSQGDPTKIQKAKSTILYGIIGLVVSLSAFAIVSFVMKGL